MLNAYLFFHCNLAFSSIEEEQRGVAIDRCYSPMLDLAEIHGIPIGVEATGWTLEQIELLRPEWITRLRRLLASGQCEFIGSGYAQIIGPLVPAIVNAANQRIGQEVYQGILGGKPAIAVINEQAFSSGIMEHYIENGYRGAIMEWDNPAHAHPEWPGSYRYAPQKARDYHGRQLDLIWNQSAIFQQVQRVAHGDLELEDFLSNMKRHMGDKPRALCIYGNDAEIFNFRPGRFATEATLQNGEWSRVAEAIKALRDRLHWRFCLPGQVLYLDLPGSGNIITLETARQPVPVKKQPKYNLLRWAVSGRDDLGVNSRCFRIYDKLQKNSASPENWKLLCCLWASDFRTHITDLRWEKYQRQLDNFERELGVEDKPFVPLHGAACAPEYSAPNGRWLDVKLPQLRARLNTRKGLAFESVSFFEDGEPALFGTLPHGYFQDIGAMADFFSGHVVMEAPGEHKRTDLEPVSPEVFHASDRIVVSAKISNFYCALQKRITFYKDKPSLRMQYFFEWENIPACAVRLLHLTLTPSAFDAQSLFYATHNGGAEMEYFPLRENVAHNAPVSFLVSASHALGMTEGVARVGDKHKYVEVIVNKSKAALVGMISHSWVDDRPLTRLILSLREFDDTSRRICVKTVNEVDIEICAKIFDM